LAEKVIATLKNMKLNNDLPSKNIKSNKDIKKVIAKNTIYM